MKQLSFQFLAQWYRALSRRERSIVAAVAILLPLVVLYLVSAQYFDGLHTKEVMLHRRESDLGTVRDLATRYAELQGRMNSLVASFEQSQMTFEQVAVEIAKIVKTVTGSDSPNLTRQGDPESVGLEYKRQNFLLTVRAISLEQLVNLLHRLEEGKSPIFLGEVDIKKSDNQKLEASLNLFSLRKDTESTEPEDS